MTTALAHFIARGFEDSLERTVESSGVMMSRCTTYHLIFHDSFVLVRYMLRVIGVMCGPLVAYVWELKLSSKVYAHLVAFKFRIRPFGELKLGYVGAITQYLARHLTEFNAQEIYEIPRGDGKATEQ